MQCLSFPRGGTNARRRPLAPVMALVVTQVLIAGPVLADPVIDQIEAARRAYQAGDNGVAIQALNFAVAAIEEQQTKAQLALFPDPLPGWSAQAAAAESTGLATMLTGKVLQRTYRYGATGAEVKITISANSPFLAVMSGLMQMPMLLQADPSTSLYSFDGHRGLIKQENGSSELSLMVGSNLLVQLKGSGGADKDMLEAYLQAMDIPALEAALAP